MKLTKKIFDAEVSMCQKLFQEKKGCNWGKCKDCGVVPLLYKLHSDLLVEKKGDIAKLKKNFLS